MVNVEELREICLLQGTDVEEKMPFQAFKTGQSVLCFYVCGHIFCYFDIDNFDVVTVKCQPELIDDLKEQHSALTNPYQHRAQWIGIVPALASHELATQMVTNSYKIVKSKYKPKHKTN
ncbi:MAG: MmcQ/YjbR family DNA-binding protein [Bacteroidales bacterium]|nr:MmcQ/YjbR family DNA-binding protein [Bacteroidales bacterium]